MRERLERSVRGIRRTEKKEMKIKKGERIQRKRNQIQFINF